MSEVRNLSEVKHEPNKAAVALLEELLGKAKRGDVVTLAIAAEIRGNETLRAHTVQKGSNIATVYLALERVKLALLRYRRDSLFRGIVDMLEAWIHRAELTPTEIREAAILAATHYELRHVPALRYVGGAFVTREEDSPRPGDPAPVVFVDGRRYRIDDADIGGREDDNAAALRALRNMPHLNILSPEDAERVLGRGWSKVFREVTEPANATPASKVRDALCKDGVRGGTIHGGTLTFNGARAAVVGQTRFVVSPEPEVLTISIREAPFECTDDERRVLEGLLARCAIGEFSFGYNGHQFVARCALLNFRVRPDSKRPGVNVGTLSLDGEPRIEPVKEQS